MSCSRDTHIHEQARLTILVSFTAEILSQLNNQAIEQAQKTNIINNMSSTTLSKKELKQRKAARVKKAKARELARRNVDQGELMRALNEHSALRSRIVALLTEYTKKVKKAKKQVNAMEETLAPLFVASSTKANRDAIYDSYLTLVTQRGTLLGLRTKIHDSVSECRSFRNGDTLEAQWETIKTAQKSEAFQAIATKIMLKETSLNQELDAISARVEANIADMCASHPDVADAEVGGFEHDYIEEMNALFARLEADCQ